MGFVEKLEEYEKTLKTLMDCMNKLIEENKQMRENVVGINLRFEAICKENDELMKKQIELEKSLKK